MSIAKRYTLYTFLVVFSLGAVFTPIMSITSYRREYEKVLDQIHQINHSHFPFLVSSLWMTHYDLLQQQIDSIIQFPYVDRVEITDDEGKLYWRDVDGGSFHKTEDLERHHHVLTYEYRGEEIELGTFTLFINISRLREDVLKGQTLFLLYQLFLLIVLAATVSLLFHYMIGRHLRSFSEFIRDRGSTSLSLSFSFERGVRQNDELEQLFGAVNTMRRKLYTHLKEKELILREVHHRIKNNMATVQGLLSMQAEMIDNPEAYEILNQAISRLQSMHVLYDKLYQKGPVEAMSVREYLPTLLEEVFAVFPGGEKIDLHTELEDMVLDAQKLSVLGILVNELVTNTLKHAFQKKERGHVEVSLRTCSDGLLEFIYRDDGRGIPESVIKEEATGLGMMLIRGMADQLGGSLEIEGKDGTVFRIIFPGRET